jgi:hypothetical protein
MRTEIVKPFFRMGMTRLLSAGESFRVGKTILDGRENESNDDR